MKIILDSETTRQRNPETGKGDPSPYTKGNKLVTVQIKEVETGNKHFLVFSHNEMEMGQNVHSFQVLGRILQQADEIIGHNLKFDIQWLLASGFSIKSTTQLYDTMIFEYITGKSRKKIQQLSLKALAEEYGLPLKLDILEDYWQKGINTDAVPLKELEEYAMQDIDTTEALYNLQRKKYTEDEDVRFVWPAIKLTNEALRVIIDIEGNGCYIDKPALEQVKQEYIKELNELEKGIRTKIHDLMGDTPINLNSPDDMNLLFYGRMVIDKEDWGTTFNIGTSERNLIKKKKYPRKYDTKQLKKIIKEKTMLINKTEASQCPTCKGYKKVRKIKKDGTPFKKDNVCPNCSGEGMLYTANDEKAGLQLSPISSMFATAAGFATDKKVIEEYLSRESLDDETKAFLRAIQRHSAISNYLDTFVEGIEKNVKEDLLLHTNLNQCVTATGRLSSSNPNFQNLPRGNTFPVRRAIRSRFDNGAILEVDFAGLEYVTAVMLSECPVGLESILSGKDRHQVSAEIIFGKKKEEYATKEEWKEIRQEAKLHTFKPLYGGETGTEAEQRYYKAFLDEHTGIRRWHEELCNEALSTGQIATPTGRLFAFPNAKRMFDGKVKGKTQIVNYPVQSVATSDIIWNVIIEIYNEMKKAGLRSKLILQVHDSIIADVHPNEKEQMIQIFKKAFDKVHELLYTRYSYQTNVPIKYEMKIGNNWCDLKEVA